MNTDNVHLVHLWTFYFQV